MQLLLQAFMPELRMRLSTMCTAKDFWLCQNVKISLCVQKLKLIFTQLILFDYTLLRFHRVDLDADHYGLDKLKRRVIEYLAVRQIKNSLKGPILCFVGPPGVGKTSVGRSIAHTLGREFHR